MLKPLTVIGVVRGGGVTVGERLPVELRPALVAHDGLVDSLVVSTFRLDGDRQPARPLCSLDPVAVPPISPRELAVVVQDELVDAVDQVEVTLPRDVARL